MVFLKQVWQQYMSLKWERKMLVSAALLALIPIAASWLWRPSDTPPKEPRPHGAEVDTYIPKGFVLVPIEVQNYEALDSVLGRFGIVDLFQAATPENPHQQLVARNVRLLRAPQNPSHFAVLVPEAEAPRILRAGAQFTVTLKRAGTAGTEFVEGDGKPVHRTIVYEGNER